jgi:hypothetical protein
MPAMMRAFPDLDMGMLQAGLNFRRFVDAVTFCILQLIPLILQLCFAFKQAA